MNVGMVPLVDWWNDAPRNSPDLPSSLFEGLLWGEACFAALVSGFWGRRWLDGFLLGILLSFVGAFAFVFGTWILHGWHTSVLLEICYKGPVYLLCAAVPAYAFRHLLGWELVRRDRTTSRSPFSLQDLLGGVAVAGAAIALLRGPQILWEWGGWYWFTVVKECALVVVVGLLIIPSIAWLTLGGRSRLVSVVGFVALVAVGFLTTVIAAQFEYPRDASWAERAQELKRAVPLTAGATAMLYASVFALRFSGVSLRSRHSAADGHPAPQSWRRTGWQVGGVLAVALGVSFYLGYLEAWRANRDRENAHFESLAAARGGGVYIDAREITGLKLFEGARDGDLRLFEDCAAIDDLELTDSALTDAGLADIAAFRKLQILELDNTVITGRGLIHVSHRLEHLNANHTLFDDHGCSLLPRFLDLEYISLEQTRITDEGTKYFARLPQLRFVVLRQTEITGSELSGLKSARYLDLDNTRVDDAGIVSLRGLRGLEWLYLRSTRISGRAIDSLTTLHALQELYLDDTAFTDEGVEELVRLPGLEHLSLAGTEITGASFKHWNQQARIRYLNLSRSKLADEHVRWLSNLPRLYRLFLTDTAISDACLPDLSKVQTDYLDLINTRITVNGLLNCNWSGVSRMGLAPGQFSDTEVQLLRQQLPCSVELFSTSH
jgi:hypothetical protein